MAYATSSLLPSQYFGKVSPTTKEIHLCVVISAVFPSWCIEFNTYQSCWKNLLQTCMRYDSNAVEVLLQLMRTKQPISVVCVKIRRRLMLLTIFNINVYWLSIKLWLKGTNSEIM